MNLPYRAAAIKDHLLAPALNWTRKVTIPLAILGTILPVLVTCDLFTDHGCPSKPVQPHIIEGVVLLMVGALLAFVTITSHRRTVGWVAGRVRVRSLTRGVLVSAATLLVPLLFATASAATAAWFYFTYAFHLCFDGVFKLGGC